jgi:hypothetical protein
MAISSSTFAETHLHQEDLINILNILDTLLHLLLKYGNPLHAPQQYKKQSRKIKEISKLQKLPVECNNINTNVSSNSPYSGDQN